MNDFSLWPLGQINFLLKIVESPNHLILANGKSEGGSSKELKKKGYIIPFGRVGRAIRWKLIKPVSQKEITELREMAK